MRTLIAQSKLETKLLYRDKAALLWTLAFPVSFIILFGLIYEGIGETWGDIGAPINYLMPAIMVFFYWQFPAGLPLYSTTQALFSIGQQYFILNKKKKRKKIKSSNKKKKHKKKFTN